MEVNSALTPLADIVILASAAIFVVTIFLHMKISSVIGYFVAGAAIGLHGLGLVSSYSLMDALAEFGIVFLLFLIGLELTFERLAAMRSHVFGFGTLQVIITMSAIILICIMLGLGVKESIIIGGSLALSSTAIVLQVLQETGKASGQVGRLSVAVLILQDFAVVPLLVLVPLLNSGDAVGSNIVSHIFQALTKASIALIAIFITGRLLLRPLFKSIASMKSNELFMSTTFLIILGASYVTEHFNLSMALGAFVAGLLVAETEYRHEVEQVVLPFKRLLLGLFFMTVGMSINLHLMIEKLPIVLLMSTSLIALKATIIILLCRLFRFKWGSAMNAGLLLAQGGEFAFILFGLDDTKSLLGDSLSQIMMIVVTLTMAVTPLLSSVGVWAAKKIDGKDKIDAKNDTEYDISDIEHYAIIAGCGSVGMVAAKVLTMEKVNYVMIDPISESVEEGKKLGLPVYSGDITKLAILESIEISRASVVVLTMRNEVTVQRALSILKSNFPDVSVVIRTKASDNMNAYLKMGADAVIPEASETGLQLAAATLSRMGMNEHFVKNVTNRFRVNHYNANTCVEE